MISHNYGHNFKVETSPDLKILFDLFFNLNSSRFICILLNMDQDSNYQLKYVKIWSESNIFSVTLYPDLIFDCIFVIL